MEEKGENRDTIKGLKWHCLAQSPGLAMRFSGLLCADYGGNLLIICQPGKPAGADLFFAVYLLIFFLRVGWTHVVIQSA